MDHDFVEVIAAEVEADPSNMALREDYITVLMQVDLDRAKSELDVFEDAGGDPARTRLMRARLMAARLRTPGLPSEAGALAGSPTADQVEAVSIDQPALDPTAPQTGPAQSGPAQSGPAQSGPAQSGPVRASMHDDAHGRASDQFTTGPWELESPDITLDDVAGLAEVKRHLDLTFLAPLRNPELAAAFGQKPGGSMLMYGPPGCGKTFIAKAIAGDLGASFLHVTLADLLNEYIGESEKAIRALFRYARASLPCVVFLDEFDAIGGRRSSGGGGSHWIRMIVTQLLEELDGVASANDGLYFLTATNRPWDIDPALRRPGRIDKTVLVLPPDLEARAAIVAHHLEGKPTSDIDVSAIAAASEGFSGADLVHAVDVALQAAMEASMAAGALRPVTTAALWEAVKQQQPSTRSWFDQIAPVLEYGSDDGTFDQLRSYCTRNGLI